MTSNKFITMTDDRQSLKFEEVKRNFPKLWPKEKELVKVL
jgi:hypothetical protein